MRWIVLTAIAVFGQGSQQPRVQQAARQINIERSPRGGDSFTPPTISVWAGDQVTWKNLTTEDHDPGVLNKDGAKTPRLDKNGQQVFVPGYVKIRSRFLDFAGIFVVHCHILGHEDRGMMQLVEVVSNKTLMEHYH